MGENDNCCVYLIMSSFARKEQNHYARSNMRVKDGDVCHIPQLDFFFNTFLASCQGLTWLLRCAFSLPLSFVSPCELPFIDSFTYLFGGWEVKLAEILFVSLLLINESSTEQRFSLM